jgi:hypothetical protein
MPDIMGIELRTICIEPGIEHEKVTAKIYINNVKAGELVDDGWCDEIYVEFKNHAMMDKFLSIMFKFYGEKGINSETPDLFINDLLRINKQYKGVKDPTISGCFQISFIGN